jgi:hypothetical protein
MKRAVRAANKIFTSKTRTAPAEASVQPRQSLFEYVHADDDHFRTKSKPIAPYTTCQVFAEVSQ